MTIYVKIMISCLAPFVLGMIALGMDEQFNKEYYLARIGGTMVIGSILIAIACALIELWTV